MIFIVKMTDNELTKVQDLLRTKKERYCGEKSAVGASGVEDAEEKPTREDGCDPAPVPSTVSPSAYGITDSQIAKEVRGDSLKTEGRLSDVSSNDKVRQAVRQQYRRVAIADAGCDTGSGCCDASLANVGSVSQSLGYTTDDIGSVPLGANLGLGCGNPEAIAHLSPGETVLDLGSGGGFDCFLAARKVGTSGQVIGVDMTPEMVSKARDNAEQGGYRNVEFRLGEIESLPVADRTVDVIMSNCVLNLSPDKPRVFAEAYRVLKPQGRLAISDIVAFAELPEDIRGNMAFYTGCIAGASLISEIETMLHGVGFAQVRIARKDESLSFIRDWAPGTPITDYVVSATIEAIKLGN